MPRKLFSWSLFYCLLFLGFCVYCTYLYDTDEISSRLCICIFQLVLYVKKIQLALFICTDEKKSNVLKILSFTAMKGRWESNINVLFRILFTLSNKKLTTRINCFHLWFVIFQIGNLYVGHLCELNHRSRGEGRELSTTSAWWQFPALFSAPAVEHRIL